MDIKLFVAVIKRFKRLVLGGLVLAIVLAVFSYGTPGMRGGKPTVIARGAETWESQAELLITQASDPYGRAVEEYTGGTGGTPAAPVGDQSYMSNLGPIYAAIADGTTVQRELAKADPGGGSLNATQVINTATSFAEPFIDLTATSTSGPAAARLAQTASSILINYVTHQQAAAGIAPSDRVELQVVENGEPPQMTNGPSKSLPMLVFVAVLGAAIALAFMRENADPRTAAALGRVPGQTRGQQLRAPEFAAPSERSFAARGAEPVIPRFDDESGVEWSHGDSPRSKNVMELLRPRKGAVSADSEG